MDLNFRIHYKKGITNAAADALSRCPTSNTVLAISTTTPTWLERLQEGYYEDDNAKQLLSELAFGPTADGHYTLLDGIIRYKGRIRTFLHRITSCRPFMLVELGAILGFMLLTTELRVYLLGQR
jgi:hypothetical protein